jgi:hypothetical protein
MSRALITLRGSADRARAMAWVEKAPAGTRITFQASRRSLPQNAKLWCLLTEVASQREHCGRKYTPDQWKVLFMHACGREVQFIPALDGSTFIPWGFRSSDLSKDEMSELIEFIIAWGAEHGVKFKDDAEAA